MLLLALLASQPVYAVFGTGTLFIYSNSACTTLLPQASGGNAGCLFPATGTTVYVKVTGITETGVNVIDLQYSGAPSDAVLSTSVSGGRIFQN